MAAKRKVISIHEKKPGGLTLGRFFYWITLISFCGVIIYAVFFSGFLSINKVDVAGLQEISREAVLENINPEINGKYFKFIDKNNLLLAQKEIIEKKLIRGFVKIENVQIKKKFPNVLVINIKERESTIILCSSGDCYIIDRNGTAYSGLDYSLPEVSENKLIVLTDLSNKSIKKEETVLSSDYLEYILEIKEKAKNSADVEIKDAYETPGLISNDIRIITAEGWRIFLNKNISFQKEIDMLRIVLDEKIQDKRKDLEYVDLRSENKVYYKFREGTQEEVNKEENSQSVPAEEKKDNNKKKKK
jgi:cell division protein FtsQ